jgi:acetylornithine deacetylase/succinyl-diaminopimelate desuccinylase-like protein
MAALPDRALAEGLALATALFDRLAAAGVATREMASGAGHDCATSAGLGVPSAMLFLRNGHRSHNAHEALDMADVGARLAVLAPAVDELLG